MTGPLSAKGTWVTQLLTC